MSVLDGLFLIAGVIMTALSILVLLSAAFLPPKERSRVLEALKRRWII